ncbi:MAG: DUF11 domain-containing protein, partial [Chloroflexi bacterium]|nr:DUF11 domain-containing protein [Chloroflexota bacterium]
MNRPAQIAICTLGLVALALAWTPTSAAPLGPLSAATSQALAASPLDRTVVDATEPVADGRPASPDATSADLSIRIVPQKAAGGSQPNAGSLGSDQSDPPPNTVWAGNEIVYGVVVSNSGPDSATDVVVTVDLPLGVRYLADTGGCVRTGLNPAGGDRLRCELGTLARFDVIEFEVKTRVDPTLVRNEPTGTKVVTAEVSVTSATGDPNLQNNSDEASCFVQDLADLKVTKLVEPTTTVRAGDTFTYTIFVDNFGPSAARNVTITDTLLSSANVSIQSCAFSVSQGGGSITQFTCTTGNLVSTQFGSDIGTMRTNFVEPLSPQSQGRLRASFRLKALQAMDVTNTVRVTANTPDPDMANNMAMSGIAVTATADLVLTAPCDPDSMRAGESTTCTFRVTNNGPSRAEGTRIELTVPAVFEVLTLSGTRPGGAAGCNAGTVGDPGDPASCDFGRLGMGQSGTMVIELRSRPDAVTDNVSDRLDVQIDAVARSTTFDPNLANNFGFEPVELRAEADLRLQKFAVGIPLAGREFHYEYQVHNEGPSVARDVTLRDFLPRELVFLSAQVDLEGAAGGVPLACDVTVGSNALFCPLGDIPPTDGTPVYVFVNVRIPSSVPGGTFLTNSADLFLTDTPDPDTQNNTADVNVLVRSEAELAVVKTASDLNPAAGEQLMYTVSVTNNGPSDAFDVEVTDQLPQGFNYVADSDHCVEAPVGSGSLTCRPAGSDPTWILPAGQTVTFDILVELDQSVIKDEQRTNEACAFAENAGEVEACGDVTVRIDRVADLRIRKFGKPDNTVRAGEPLTYTLFVDNLGPSFTTPVVVTDTIISDKPFYLLGIEPDLTHQYAVVCRYESRDPFSDLVLFSGEVPPGIAAPIGPLPGNLTVTCNNASGGGMQVFGPSNDPANGPGRWMVNIAVMSNLTSSINNLATVAGPDYDPDPTNNIDETAHSIQDISDVFVDKFSFGQVTQPGCPPESVEMDGMVTAGNPLRWTIAVGNEGPSPAENMKIIDRLPKWITVTDYEVIDGAGNIVGDCQTGAPGDPLDRLTCGFGDLSPVPASATATRWINIEAMVDPGAPEGAILENDVMVMSDFLDTDNSNNFASSLTTVKTAADLAVIKTHKPDPVVAGEALRYTVTVVNNGPSNAKNVSVADQLPMQVRYLSAQTNPKSAYAASCGYNPLMRMVTCNLGTLPAGATAIFDVDVTVNPDAVPSGQAATIIDNGVMVMSDTFDPCEVNNSFVDRTNVRRQSSVKVAKSDSPDPVLAGTEVTYHIRFDNGGPSTATNVVVRDQLPAGLSYVRCEPADPANQVTCVNLGGGLVEVTEIKQAGAVVWNNTQGTLLNDLNPGEAYSFDLVAFVSEGYVLDGLGDLGPGTCRALADAARYPHFAFDRATVSALTSNANIGECTRVDAAADLQVEKTDLVDLGLGPENAYLACDQVAPGGMITYTLTVTNHGPSDAAEVVLTDYLPEEFLAVDPAQVLVQVLDGEGVVEEVRDDGRITVVLGNDPARLGVRAGQDQLGRINDGESASVVIAVMVRRDAPCGGIVRNEAVVTTRRNDTLWPPLGGFGSTRTPTADPEPANNGVTETTTIECPSVKVTKTVSYDGTCPGVAYPTVLPTGVPVTFCFEVTNTGTTYLDEIQLTDTLDTRTTMPTVIFTDTIRFGRDPKVPVAPGETVKRQVTVPSLYKECGTATDTVVVVANPVNSGRTDLPCLPLVSDSDTRNINIPCAGVDWRIALPILESNEGAECEAWLQVQNVGDVDTKAVLVVWGDPGFCPPQSAGPLKVECTGLLRPGSAWSFAAGQMPAGARSAIAYAMNAQDVVADFDGNNRLFADVVCGALFDYIVGDHDRWATFDRAYRLGDLWRGPRDFSGQQLVLDFGAHQGEPLTVSVNRSCPDAGDPNAKSNAAYTGLSRDQMGVRDPYSGAYMYYAPLIFASNAGLNTTLYLQNLGEECSSLEIWLKGQDNCLRPIIGDILTLSPGESVAFDPNTVVGPDWLGSAWIRATQPLAIVVDAKGTNHFTAYTGVAADVDDAGYTAGNQVNFAPLIYSEYQGWDTAIQVQNLS